MDHREYYNRYWSNSDLDSTDIRLPHEVLMILREYVSNGASCLDIGCGNGEKVRDWVKSSNINYQGVDISSEAVKAAQALELNARTIADPSRLPFEDSSFDSVISFEVLEHLFDPMSVMREAERVLRPGGTMIVTVPNVAFLRSRIQMMRGIWNPLGDDRSVSEPWRDPHIRFFTINSLRSLMSQAGFNVVDIGGHFDSRKRPRRTFNGLVTNSRRFLWLQKKAPALLGVRLLIVGAKP